jgi:site-specific DNA recombinase
MTEKTKVMRCAVYTRKSSEEGLEQSFNSLHAQREACEAYIVSQRHEGWQLIPTAYDDGGFSGGTMERPALKRLLEDVALKKVDNIIVYKVDRLTRSLADFARIVDAFDKQGISFVSVTQQFNTTTSMGRLTLNVLLSFAQFEREVTGERIRDKIAASKRKGMWMGGVVPMGYVLDGRLLKIDEVEAERVRSIFELYLELGCVSKLRTHLHADGIRSKKRVSQSGRTSGDATFSRGALYLMLKNQVYLGLITHKEASYPGQHPAIIEQELFDRVQSRLADNMQAPHSRPRTAETSLLTGLLFDKDGDRFIPSHANKKGRRYRYYVLRPDPTKASTRKRSLSVPAQELEDLVRAEVTSLFRSPLRMMELRAGASLTPAQLSQTNEQLQDFVMSLEIPSLDLDRLLRSLIARVLLDETEIRIEISSLKLSGAIWAGVNASADTTDQIIVLSSAGTIKRCGGELRLLLAPDSSNGKAHQIPSLLRAVATAHDWLDRILKGRAKSQRDVAAQDGHDERYVARILPLAFLAPDITESILEGTQLASLSLDGVRPSLSQLWEEQRIELSAS